MPSVSRSQQRLFGAVHNCQKTGKCASTEIKKIAATISKKGAEDFAKTKHNNLPENKTKKFKEWIEKNHPEFALEENILGSIALGAAALAKTAIKDKNSYRPKVRDLRKGILGSQTEKTDYNTTNFIRLPWNWSSILNYKTNMPNGGIIGLFYVVNAEETPDNLVPINFIDYHSLSGRLKTPSIKDVEIGRKNLELDWKNNAKSREYWHDGNINKFYQALDELNLKPDNFGGKDIRKQI